MKKIQWLKLKKEYLIKEEKIIVIQINGKKRNTITIKDDIDEKELIDKIKEMKLADKYIKNVEILKTIYVKNKLINIIVEIMKKLIILILFFLSSCGYQHYIQIKT